MKWKKKEKTSWLPPASDAFKAPSEVGVSQPASVCCSPSLTAVLLPVCAQERPLRQHQEPLAQDGTYHLHPFHRGVHISTASLEQHHPRLPPSLGPFPALPGPHLLSGVRKPSASSSFLKLTVCPLLSSSPLLLLLIPARYLTR